MCFNYLSLDCLITLSYRIFAESIGMKYMEYMEYMKYMEYCEIHGMEWNNMELNGRRK